MRADRIPDARRTDEASDQGTADLDPDGATPDQDPDGATPDLLRRTAERAIEYRASLPKRRVGAAPELAPADLRRRLAGPLPRTSTPAAQVIDELIDAVAPGLVAMSGPRYFGFVVGGAVPASLAADWLVSTWDQMSGLYVGAPAAAVVEEVVSAWVLELLGLPADASVGFTTGATMANFTASAAARHQVLRRAGWDVEADGLQGAPPVRVIVGADAHASLLLALRYAGFGARRAERMPADEMGRMDAGALAAALQGRDDPTIVCAQLGEVNTGACDAIGEIADHVRAHPNAWLHVDGAFGLWAAASPRMRPLLSGHDAADSWATDAHKWLNVPYDAGLVVVRDPRAHTAAMGTTAAYLPPAPGANRDPFDWVPEMSRRARGFTIHAAIRELGAEGIAALVERCCDLARLLGDRLVAAADVRLVADVILNQVLVDVGDAEMTRDVVARIVADGTIWAGATTFHERPAIRISVSNWTTREHDVDAAVDAIARCVRDARAGRARRSRG
jgi:glutamate/tyrosine decarboxylase-like PLP-dependent enzyme